MNVHKLAGAARMIITAASTGTVRVKRAMARGNAGPLRRVGLVLPGPFSDDLPIHVWAVEHADGVLLVDHGSSPDVRDAPFARFSVGADDDLLTRLRSAGVDPDRITTVVLTHLHGDHMDGLGALPGREVRVGADELRAAAGPMGRLQARVTRQPLPSPFSPTPLVFDGPALGGFPATAALTPDGSVLAVPTPGHTPGHLSVLVVEDDVHVLLAGDVTYDEAQLLDRAVDGVAPRAAVARASIDRVLDHARRHPTVYLPTHDRGAAGRLADRTPLAVPAA